MKKEDSVLVKRVKSLLWRGGMMALATFIGFLANSLAELGLPTWAVVSGGLLLGELSKYLNSPAAVPQ